MIAMIALGGAASAAEAVKFNIPAQSLETALNTFGVQSQHTVMFKPELASGKFSLGVVTSSDPEIALAQLLAGTGLTYRRQGDLFLIVQPGEGAGGPQSAGAAGDGAEVEALIVTAQKKEEAIQDVPIAISAFTQKSLDAQKIEGGFDLLKAIPNVTFSKNNFNGYNFSIRGVGTKAVSATTDPGVAVSFNNTTLIINRLFEQEYFDVERVEVLRGPQGTLYGRNATSGVINVLSARPRLGDFAGDIELETGNYNAQRVRGMINVPIGDKLALRIAGALTKRDGYGINEAADDPNAVQDVRADVDDRDLWSVRATLGWEPIEQIRVNLLWERFEEDDRRVRTSKQLCHRDGGFDSPLWEEVAETVPYGMDNPALIMGQAMTSQGCLAGSLYEDGAFGTPNGASLPYVGGLFWASHYGASYFDKDGLGPNPYHPDHLYYQITGLTPPTAPCPAAAALPYVSPLSMCQPDPYAGLTQSRDIRTIYSLIEPSYRAKADIFELTVDFDLTESLTLTSQTVFNRDQYYATQDYNRFTTYPIFNDSTDVCGTVDLSMFGLGEQIGPCPAGMWDLSGPLGAPPGTFVFDGSVYAPTPDRPEGYYYNLTPGGIFTDPQLGPSSTLVGQDLSEAQSEQFNQEFRLVSNYDAPFNFSLGANFTRFETLIDYYVFLNSASLMANMWPFNAHTPDFNINGCGREGAGTLEERIRAAGNCVYIDPNPLASINGEGHNYFRSANPYQLTSAALFGEVYWQATETLKFTLGGRMTWDRKVFSPVPSQMLLWDYRPHVPDGAGPAACTDAEKCRLAGTGIGGRGSPPLPDIVQQWAEPTGRLIVDWKPDLAWTDESMFYASYAHGYKGGGANPPNIAPPSGIFNARNSGGVNPPTFEPEFIDAFEVGTKNTLLGGGLILNASAFYYAYEEYQVSKIVDRSAYNENFDATIWGVETEWIFSPTRNLRFNGTIGYLNSEIGDGERSIDLMNRAFEGAQKSSWIDAAGVEHQLGYDEWMVLKPWIASTSNCVAPKEIVEELIVGQGGTMVLELLRLCPGGQAIGMTFAGGGLPSGRSYDPVTEAPNGGAGFFTELAGNELPNAPHWTVSFGAQYRFELPAGWDATLRGDFYWQDKSYARVYNTEYDRLEAWTNTNISLWFEQRDWGVIAEVYVKNAFDEEPITDAFLNSDDSGLTTNVFTLDPRLIGVSVRKQF